MQAHIQIFTTLYSIVVVGIIISSNKILQVSEGLHEAWGIGDSIPLHIMWSRQADSYYYWMDDIFEALRETPLRLHCSHSGAA